MTALSQIARDRALDALNAVEMASEQALVRPTVIELAKMLSDAGQRLPQTRSEMNQIADLMRSRMAANQCAYFRDRDRANASGTAAFALRVEPASPSRPSRLQSTFAKGNRHGLR